MMKKCFWLIILVFSLRCSACGEVPETVVSVTVVDEAGHPIEGARVQGLFPYGTSRDLRPAPIGYTDANGKVALKERAISTIDLVVEKDGYYRSRKNAPNHYRTVPGESRNEFFDVALTLVLRQILNPIPMYVRTISTRIPEFRRSVGFDLQRMDWVSPHGEGQEADVFFTLTGDFVDADEFDMQLTLQFPGKGNGIIVQDKPMFSESAFKSPHEAPLDGYQNDWVLGMRRLGLQRARQQNKENYFEMERNESRVYVFRVRSEVDVNGHIIGGNYGKIHGDFDFGVPIDRPAYLMGFTIYFNSVKGSRNLEFDLHQNLSGEQITVP